MIRQVGGRIHRKDAFKGGKKQTKTKGEVGKVSSLPRATARGGIKQAGGRWIPWKIHGNLLRTCTVARNKRARLLRDGHLHQSAETRTAGRREHIITFRKHVSLFFPSVLTFGFCGSGWIRAARQKSPLNKWQLNVTEGQERRSSTEIKVHKRLQRLIWTHFPASTFSSQGVKGARLKRASLGSGSASF